MEWFQGYEFYLPNETVSFIKVSHHKVPFLDIVPTHKLIGEEWNNLEVSSFWSFPKNLHHIL